MPSQKTRLLITYALIGLSLAPIGSIWLSDASSMHHISTRGEKARSPRRPSPFDFFGSIYDVDPDGPAEDSQGTAFIIDSRGGWLTAGHVTHGCSKLELVINEDRTAPASSVVEDTARDISLIRGGLSARSALPLSSTLPADGSIGYHMGYPGGEPAVIGTRLIGKAGARQMNGRIEPMLAWAEQWRSPDGNDELDGLSGGLVLTPDGRVVGVISAATNRRGRILTTHPETMRGFAAKYAPAQNGPAPAAIPGPREALARFRAFMANGLIRQVYCEV